jgi:TonB family protein
MKRLIQFFLIAFLLVTLFNSGIWSQSKSTEGENQKEKTDANIPFSKGNDTIFFDIPDSIRIEYNLMPEFPGGDKALGDFVKENTIYPQTAINDSVQGRVMVIFVVNSEGNVDKIDFLRKVRADLDNECIRVIKKLPKFKPGMQCTYSPKGWYWHPSDVWYMVPFNFQFHDGGNTKGILILPKKRNNE